MKAILIPLLLLLLIPIGCVRTITINSPVPILEKPEKPVLIPIDPSALSCLDSATITALQNRDQALKTYALKLALAVYDYNEYARERNAESGRQ